MPLQAWYRPTVQASLVRVFLLLHLDILSDNFFVDADCGNKESFRPDSAVVPIYFFQECKLFSQGSLVEDRKRKMRRKYLFNMFDAVAAAVAYQKKLQTIHRRLSISHKSLESTHLLSLDCT